MQTHIHSILQRPNLGLLMANLIQSRPQYNGATILSLLVLSMHNKFPHRQTKLLPGVGCFGLLGGSLLLTEPFRFAVCLGLFLSLQAHIGMMLRLQTGSSHTSPSLKPRLGLVHKTNQH